MELENWINHHVAAGRGTTYKKGRKGDYMCPPKRSVWLPSKSFPKSVTSNLVSRLTSDTTQFPSSTPQVLCNTHPRRRLPPSLHCEYGIPRESLSQRHGHSPLGCYCESDFRSELHHVRTSRSFDRLNDDASTMAPHHSPLQHGRHAALLNGTASSTIIGHHRHRVNLANADWKTPFSAGWF